MKRFVLILILLCPLLTSLNKSKAPTPSEDLYEIIVEEDMPVPMSDGTILRADIYRPKVNGRYPVLVGRVGYKLRDWPGDIYTVTGEYYSKRGYVVLWQNVRGTFNSEGEYYPFRDDAWGENKDGYETIEWAAQKEWSNGEVGMLGVSYSGLTQYLTAPTRPPHLVTQFVQMGWGSAYNCLFHNGFLELYNTEWWPLGMTLLQIQDKSITLGISEAQNRLERTLEDIDNWHRHLPLKDNPSLDGLADWYGEWLQHPAYGSFWRETDLATMYDEVDVPILHWSGWFDYRVDATINAFMGISKYGKSEKSRNGQYLIIGPWNHFSAPSGDINFGAEASIDADVYRLKWYDYWLKGIDNGIMDNSKIKIFLMGENKWIDLDEWPPQNNKELNLFFREGTDKDNISINNGLLTVEQPEINESPDSFIYNPEEPIPSQRSFLDPGPKDYSKIENLLLTYSTDILENDMKIIGNVKVVLYFKSSAEDTDWIVRLCDVWPDGRSMSVSEGMLRARYRNSLEREDLLIPDKVYEVEIEMSPTAQVFKKGHQLRIQVTSSDFPWFDRNLNTGGKFGEEVESKIAVNNVLHDSLHPSHIILPISQ